MLQAHARPLPARLAVPRFNRTPRVEFTAARHTESDSPGRSGVGGPGQTAGRVTICAVARSEGHGMNPFTRIGLETAAVIIVMIILMVLAAYLLGSFTR